jgi:hypothetical protein
MSKNNPLSGGTRDSSIMGVSGLNGIATLEYPNSYGLNPMSLCISDGSKSWTMKHSEKLLERLLDGETEAV